MANVEIVTSFNPANTVAASLYASLGFLPTGECGDGEPLVLLRVAERSATVELDTTRAQTDAQAGPAPAA